MVDSITATPKDGVLQGCEVTVQFRFTTDTAKLLRVTIDGDDIRDWIAKYNRNMDGTGMTVRQCGAVWLAVARVLRQWEPPDLIEPHLYHVGSTWGFTAAP